MTEAQQIIDQISETIDSELKVQTQLSCTIEQDDAVLRISPTRLKDFFSYLNELPLFSNSILLNVTAVDWVDSREERFEVVYHLLGVTKKARVRVSTFVSEENPEVASLADIWHSANFMEREVWDMFGIRFSGHPDLRRVLMYEEFKGHPLRKDYPVQGKQPRIPLRHPEVRNTAMDMARPSLVQISRKGDNV